METLTAILLGIIILIIIDKFNSIVEKLWIK